MNPKKVLIVVSVEDAEGELADILRGFSEEGKSGIFLCLNKPATYRKKILEQQKIDCTKILMLDPISGKLGEYEDTWYLQEINLTKIAKTLRLLVNKEPKKDFIFIESLRTLQIYEDEKNIQDFLKELDQLAIEHGAAIFAVVVRHTSYQDFNSYFDKIIEVR